MEMNECVTQCSQSSSVRYYVLLERLLQVMTDMNGLNLRKLNSILAELCQMFRLSKGVVRFFQGLNYEMQDKGDTFVCYDDGRGGDAVLNVRIVTKVNAVVTCTVLMPPEEKRLTDDEKAKVDLIMKTVLNFVSRVRLQNVVEMLAMHDESGFSNIRAFMRYLNQLNDLDGLGGKVALYYNLRHFSLVNQEIGERAGDVVIRNHYEGLQMLIGNAGTVCRLGGDNFVALCERMQLESVLGYLHGTPVRYDADSGSRVKVSASAGVFLIPEGFRMQQPGDIMDKIISASQAARTGGKDRVVYYDDSLVKNKERLMRVQQQFPEALRNEEFHVFYQPKINIHTGELAGAEALCRWFRNGSIIPPDAFIPVLEESTEICKLDFYMLEHVCRDLRRWLDEGREVVRISVNLSRRHMMDFDLLQNIIEIVDRYNVPHQYIEIELTETTTDVEFRALKRVVRGLQAAGIYTSVDDFGVGYSSLNLIREIPWNVLKIDRSFLPEKLDGSEDSRTIMFKYVVAMAKELGLSCIAEGVETQCQLDVLRENRCVLAQGFLFDEPLPTEIFESRLCGFRYPLNEQG
ncbi:MAG: GGDEF domain-containing protein [Oscillospiraceae bacterium]|nr:GGDEF domain-containing protein [Oscillospiraceae bacterium]